ncbi:MAG: cyclic nucleotide-binding domain-containing protein [Spirochaetes bacterium]|nr:cyclic nucleotide-binding domain-containing protein [Spirochaetota bacterium]
MLSLTLIVILALAPVPVIYLFYYRYFLVKPSYLYHLEYFVYGAILALLLLLAGQYFAPDLPLHGAAARGFLSASLVEKAGAFAMIALLTYRTPPLLMVLNMVISAMLLGLGFATVENVMYAISIREPVIFVRLFSSVPLHVLTCGIIGYGLALMRFSGSWGNRVRHALGAFMVPYLFHGTYDTLLIGGGTGTYWIAPLLVVLIAGMEYILAKSQTLPLLDGLQKHRISIEEWTTVQREPQYERWILRSMGSKNREYVPLFRLRLGAVRASVIVVLLIVAAGFLAGGDFVAGVFRYQLRGEETVMLFTLLPALYSLNLFTVGVMNPKYFQNSLIRIPIIIDVDIEASDTLIKTTAYHVTAGNCYLKTVDPIEPGTPLSLTFVCPHFSSPPVRGVAVWDSRDDRKQLSGTLARFTGRPWRYWLFLARYGLYRVSRGLFFTLRLPGFGNIRRLFVRPVSVMQKEWRFSAGYTLFNQGEEGTVFYLIRKGEVDIIKTLDTGETVLLTTLGEGDIFGELAIVGGQPRLAAAVCRTDCLLAVAEADNLDALIESNPVFTQRLIKNFANRLNSSEQTMLRSMADIGGAFRAREEKLSVLCRVLAALALQSRDTVPGGPDIEALAARLNVEKGIVNEIVTLLAGAGDGSSAERIINQLIEKL